MSYTRTASGRSKTATCVSLLSRDRAMFSNDRNYRHADSDAPFCNHREPARQLTVKKEGPNQGRTFYKCSYVSRLFASSKLNSPTAKIPIRFVNHNVASCDGDRENRTATFSNGLPVFPTTLKRLLLPPPSPVLQVDPFLLLNAIILPRIHGIIWGQKTRRCSLKYL